MPEISLLAASAGLEITASEAWMTGGRPDFSTWSVCFVCKPIAAMAAR
jgi:hypothetical protein